MAQLSSFSTSSTISIDQTYSQFNSSSEGLSSGEAKNRLSQYGPNEISGKETRWYSILIRQFTSPFLYMLVGAAILSFFLQEYTDGTMIILFITINAALGFYQEFRSEKTLQLLKKYVVGKSKVIRNGNEELISSKDIVVGDIILLQPGDIIPADIRISSSQNLVVDESILTGESVAVSKISDELHSTPVDTYAATNIGFSGTTIVSGEGCGIVISTGRHTVIGEISTLTIETTHISSFEKGIGRLSNFILKLTLGTLFFVLVVNILIKGPHIQIPTLLIFAIALAISVIPEALPVIITFSFSRGALRLAKNKVVVKRLSAIEDLGSIEVLCTDKTGTLTENKLEVSSYFPNKDVVYLASLATALVKKGAISQDSFDIALLASLSTKEREDFLSISRIDEVPFDPKRKMNSVLIKKDGYHELIVRGALENVLHACKKSSEYKVAELLLWAQNEGRQGKRVIAIAKKKVLSHDMADLAHQEYDCDFAGLISFNDPLKKTAHQAIKNAGELGIHIKILTGDSKEVAGAVAFQTGLIANPDLVVSGDEFESLSSHQQHDAVQNYAVFARISPSQKHTIIQLLQENYEVGFLGEGINDAPALKTANVGIVVQDASDIAKDAADIVLLNKSLHVIIDGIKEGRAIFGNTAKYIKATLASNFGNFYTVSIASLFIPFLPLLPLQILLINLLTDFPMIAVATDNVDNEELKLPKSYDMKEIALFATTMGIVSSLIDFLFFIFFYKISPQVLQTNWFIGCVLTELVFIFSVRTKLPIFKAIRPSFPLISLSFVAMIIALVLPFTSLGHTVFEFVSPTTHYLFIILSLTGGYFIVTEQVKLMYYSFTNGKRKIINASS